ncbi:hypothetical protein WDU94_002009 [Cyamophila willieti]
MALHVFTILFLSSVCSITANDLHHENVSTTESWFYTEKATLDPFYKKSEFEIIQEEAIKNGSKMATPGPLEARPRYIWSEAGGPTIRPHVYAWQKMYKPKYELASRTWDWDYVKVYSKKDDAEYQKKHSDVYNPMMWTDDDVLDHKEWVKHAVTPNISLLNDNSQDGFGSVAHFWAKPTTESSQNKQPQRQYTQNTEEVTKAYIEPTGSTTESWYYTEKATLDPFYKKSEIEIIQEEAIKNGSKMATPGPLEARPRYIWSEVGGPTIRPHVYAWQKMYKPKYELASRTWDWDYVKVYSKKDDAEYQKKHSDVYNPMMWTDDDVLDHKEWVKHAVTPNISLLNDNSQDGFGSVAHFWAKPTTESSQNKQPQRQHTQTFYSVPTTEEVTETYIEPTGPTTESWYYTEKATLDPFYKKSEIEIIQEEAIKNGSKMATPGPLEARPRYIWSEVGGPTIRPHVYAWQKMYKPKYELASRTWEWDYVKVYSKKDDAEYQKNHSDVYNPMMWTDDDVLDHKEWVKHAVTPDIKLLNDNSQDGFGSVAHFWSKVKTKPPRAV